MLGSSKMINLDQVQDCLDRGWIVLAPNHRLCPQVNLLEGPIQDCRDLLDWVYNGGLERFIEDSSVETCTLDLEHVFAFGTSSGGTLALSLVSQFSNNGGGSKMGIWSLTHSRATASHIQWRESSTCTDHATSPTIAGRRKSLR
jgi:acetyl esterase/lipase